MKSEKRLLVKKYLDLFLGVLGFFSLLLLVYNIGFELKRESYSLIKTIIDFVVAGFIIQEIIRWMISPHKLAFFRERTLEVIIVTLLLIQLILTYNFEESFAGLSGFFSIDAITIFYLSVIEIIIIFTIVLKLLRMNFFSKLKLHPGAVLSISFAIIILIGTLFLSLPKMTHGEGSLSIIDALFTSTSAVCVTGLVVTDTATTFSLTGKSIILILIQVGGIGIMTLTTFFTAFFAGGLSIRARIMMKDLLSHDNIGEVSSLLFKITATVIIIELAGSVLLYLSTGGNFTVFNFDQIYDSVFHSVSAFCNAGFSIFKDGMMNRLVADNYLYTATVMILIIIGGLGFIVISNIMSLRPYRFRKKRLKYQLSGSTKLILTVNFFLITGGMLLIFSSESFGFDKNMPLWDKLYHSLFQSVTARTAGFNTVPIELLLPPSAVFIMMLMWIGASPGSTGGGIKTTTFSLSLLALFSHLKNKETIEIFGRRISNRSIRRSYLVITASMLTIFAGTVLLIWMEPDKNPLDLIFEVISAISTVGLTRNVTPHLGTGGKVVVILLMFIGRMGVLTFLLAFFKQSTHGDYKLPEENIIVG